MAERFSPEKLQEINSVSPSFCLAKWLQVTVDLVAGTTHSCHHPKRHQVPLAELAVNPSALHNTEFKKKQRKAMLEGQRPSECSYCWDMEDLGHQYSDRYIKSTDPWAWEHRKEVLAQPWDSNIAPRYLEVMLDNVCNFSCAYCMADISTSIAQEMKQFGPYPVSDRDHRMPETGGKNAQTATYVAAFEKWLPEIIGQLKVLRITGGEPLLSPQFWKLLANLQAVKSPDLALAINTNMSHGEKVIQKFCDQARTLLDTRSIASIEIYASLDTFGEQADYIRHGMDYHKVIANLQTCAGLLPEIHWVIMCTYNILSIGQFPAFLEHVMELKKKHRVTLDISYLKNPGHLRADLLDASLRPKLLEGLALMQAHPESFSEHELNKLQNLVNWAVSGGNPIEVKKQQAGFYNFVNEYDRRKGKSFLSLFPEYKTFYQTCRQAALVKKVVSHKPPKVLRQILALAIAGLKVRYRKTWVGFIWVILNPILLLGIQGLVFSHVLKLSVGTYFLYLVSGLLPWIFLSQTLEMGAAQLKNHALPIKSFGIRPFQLSAALTCENLVNFLATQVLALVPLWIWYGKSTGLLLVSFLYSGLFSLAVFSMVFIFAVGNVLFKDLRYILSFVLTVFYFATPIFYTVDLVPVHLQGFVRWNPFHILLEPFQLLAASPDVEIWLASLGRSLVLTAALCALARFLWRRMQNRFYLNL